MLGSQILVSIHRKRGFKRIREPKIRSQESCGCYHPFSKPSVLRYLLFRSSTRQHLSRYAFHSSRNCSKSTFCCSLFTDSVSVQFSVWSLLTDSSRSGFLPEHLRNQNRSQTEHHSFCHGEDLRVIKIMKTTSLPEQGLQKKSCQFHPSTTVRSNPQPAVRRIFEISVHFLSIRISSQKPIGACFFSGVHAWGFRDPSFW